MQLFCIISIVINICYNKIGDDMNEIIIKNMKKHNNNLSKYACCDDYAIRIKKNDDDIRTSFFRDSDKILYSLAYIRYIDKTQVFSNNDNDMISKRMIHIQLVSKIARTIGRALNLNEDLIEAASLGHDLGHTPFGHVGEKILNEISLKNGEGYFNHNVQSVRNLINIENHGKGLNITIQVLDAILCHNGEMLNSKYLPVEKTYQDFFEEYNKSYHDDTVLKNIRPMTLEGCVVRISDIIAYIGKDIEDAIRLGKLTASSIPNSITQILGDNNSSIVNTIVLDIIENSIDKNYIKMSDKVFNALNELIEFNYKNIYLKANDKNDLIELSKKFNKLFELYYNQIKENLINEDIYILFLNDMDEKYMNETSDSRKVIDYIAGMTDDFFTKQYKKYFG